MERSRLLVLLPIVAVLALGAGGYVPLAIGAYQHPVELNIASYLAWFVIALMFFASSLSLGFSGWALPLGLAIGNGTMIVLAYYIGLNACTFNLGAAECIAYFFTLGGIATYFVVKKFFSKRQPRILYWAAFLADVLSFYPQMKQYLEPHEPMTWLGLTGWIMWMAASVVTMIVLDRVPQRFTRVWHRKAPVQKKVGWTGYLIERSLLPIEGLILMTATVYLMW